MKQLLTLLLSIIIHTLSGQCIPDSHNAFKNTGWFSCQQSTSEVSERGSKHWVLFDFAEVYSLTEMTVWNHNVWGETGMGAKSIMLDYSIDKDNWASVGPIEISKAEGSWKYLADEPIKLSGLSARYVLLTIVETWDPSSDCAGISEVRFGIEESTSVNDLPKLLTYELTPNPATDYIRLAFKEHLADAQIQIINALGQVMMTSPINGQQALNLEIAHLEEGMYHVYIVSSQKIETKSFIKM